jgi:hypothetical protein
VLAGHVLFEIEAIDRMYLARGLDLVRFAPGQRKDLVTAGYLARAGLDDRGVVPAQVLYVGVAQEKQKVFRTSKRRNRSPGPPSGRPPRPGSGSRRWTTRSPPSMTWPGPRARYISHN